MSDTGIHPTPASDAVQRAEALLDRLGQRTRQAGEALAQKSSDPVRSQAPEPPARSAQDRAEETVDRLGQQAGALYDAAGLWVRRSAALLREEAEDILADAQALRRRSP